MFYENNTQHTLFIYMSDGKQDLNDKLVTFNMTGLKKHRSCGFIVSLLSLAV